MSYGFVIDNRRCIGCHACSTACKSENEVPLGVHRTWVKYVETGNYPDTRRHFQVTRCNHCANPPCVHICPVSAMYQRTDGIVEFDKDQCIGCKACIQACPYDAIHIDPENGTAAKCHFCSHRVERGLEPACVVVCPEHAIIAGDTSDPDSEISKVLAQEDVTVRKPEQGTLPKLFYIEGHVDAMRPTEQDARDFMFATAQHAPSELADISRDQRGRGRIAGQMVSFNAQHQIYWHWPVAAYIITKDIACGIFAVHLAAVGLGLADLLGPLSSLTTATAMSFIIATTALLIGDLQRPERFWRILLRPQWRSWLTRGAFILIAFSLIVAIWGAASVAATGGLTIDPALLIALLHYLGWPLAVLACCYTAFLLGQAEGRDLWQSTLLPLQFLIRAMICGAAALIAIGMFIDLDPAYCHFLILVLTIATATSLMTTVLGEVWMPLASETASRAHKLITNGRFRVVFWCGVLVSGHLVPLLLLSSTDVTSWGSAVVAAGLATTGVIITEALFIFVPQQVPNS